MAQARKRKAVKRRTTHHRKIDFLVKAATRKEYVHFEGLTPSQVRELARRLERTFGVKFYHPKDRQNYGPTLERALKVAAKHRGRLVGYIISPIWGSDARVTIEGVGFPKGVAYKVLKELDHRSKPDDIYRRDNYVYFWWD